MVLGNLRLACGIVLSGLTYQGVNEVLSFSVNVNFYNQLSMNFGNSRVIQKAKLHDVELCGNAKYCIYTLLNKSTGDILSE